MAQTIKIDDYIEVLVDYPFGIDEKAGVKLKVIDVLPFIEAFKVRASNSINVWTFANEDLNKGIIKYTQQLPIGNNTILTASTKNSSWDTLLGIYNSGDWTGDYGNWETEITKTKPKTLCECGQSKIAGHEGDPWERHSTYCPIYKEGKLNVKK